VRLVVSHSCAIHERSRLKKMEEEEERVSWSLSRSTVMYRRALVSFNRSIRSSAEAQPVTGIGHREREPDKIKRRILKHTSGARVIHLSDWGRRGGQGGGG